MKKVAFVLSGLLIATGLALAASPHFINSTAVLDAEGNLVVSWKEAGLGNNQNVTYTASADADATYQCVNNGGRCPRAANKQEVTGTVSATGTFSSGQNGQITASLIVNPPGGTLVCPGNQHVELGAVSYSNVTLSDDTNNVTATIPTDLSVTFFVCP
jgi:hypothetical protein